MRAVAPMLFAELPELGRLSHKEHAHSRAAAGDILAKAPGRDEALDPVAYAASVRRVYCRSRTARRTCVMSLGGRDETGTRRR